MEKPIKLDEELDGEVVSCCSLPLDLGTRFQRCHNSKGPHRFPACSGAPTKRKELFILEVNMGTAEKK